MSETRTAPCACPACQHLLDAATPVDCDAKPKEGDLTVCAYCGAWLKFNADLTVTQLTLRDIDALQDDELDLLTKARHFIEERP